MDNGRSLAVHPGCCEQDTEEYQQGQSRSRVEKAHQHTGSKFHDGKDRKNDGDPDEDHLGALVADEFVGGERSRDQKCGRAVRSG